MPTIRPEARKLLRLAAPFQARHPEIVGGEINFGRIELNKRREFNFKVYEALMPDLKLRNIIIDFKLGPTESSYRVQEYALSKAGFDVRKAVEILSTHLKRVEAYRIPEVIPEDKALLKSLQRKAGVPLGEQEKEILAGNTRHITRAAFIPIINTLIDSLGPLKILEKWVEITADHYKKYPASKNARHFYILEKNRLIKYYSEVANVLGVDPQVTRIIFDRKSPEEKISELKGLALRVTNNDKDKGTRYLLNQKYLLRHIYVSSFKPFYVELGKEERRKKGANFTKEEQIQFNAKISHTIGTLISMINNPLQIAISRTKQG